MLSLLLSLTGCGGNATSAASPQSSMPITQPAQTGAGSGGSDSTSSPSSPTNSGSNNSPSGSSPSDPPPGVPDGAQSILAVQSLPSWQWCTKDLNGKVCASGIGNATSSMTPKQQTPSLSGNSSIFKLGGPTQYSNALWWKSFGPNSTPEHFAYDVYFYMTDPGAPEALEFDVNQSFGGTRYTWGSECSYKNTGHWDIWNDETGRWETTDVPCPQVSANTWHHLTWLIERVNGQVHYISVTLDGNVGTVDKYYNPQQGWNGNDVNVAFQMDGDYRQDPYSVWLDNVSLWEW